MVQRIPDTTADGRLSGLERFLEFWIGPRRPEFGEPVETLNKVELPAPLQRFYAFAGRWPPSRPPNCMNRFFSQDRLLPLEVAPWGHVRHSGALVVFAYENQGVWAAATLPEGDDPGVWLSEDCSHRTSEPRWIPLTKPLSNFLVTFILQECLFGSELGACCENALNVFSDAGLSVEPMWLDAEYAWPEVRHSYYLVDQRILLRQDTGDHALDDQWYAFRAVDAESIQHLGLPTKLG